MEPEQTSPIEPRRGGCLKWTCGGCLGVVALMAIASLVLWYNLSRWGKGESAWEHVPPSTAWALEAHDLRALIEHALRDPGVKSLAEPLIRQLEDGLAGLREREFARGQSGEELAGLYESLGFLHTLLLPNTALIGATGDRTIYLIAKLPVWFKWSLADAEEGRVIPWENDLYATFINGWGCMSTSESLLEEIVANWDAGGKPLGPTAGLRTPYMVMGGKTAKPEQAAASPPASRAEGTPMMLGNPFAGAPAPAGPEASGFAFHILMRPEAGGWQAEGSVRRSATDREIAEYMANPAVAAAEPVSLPVPDSSVHDVRAVAALTPDCAQAFRNLLPARIREGAAFWLDSVNGDFVVLAERPVVADRDFAPLPVFSLGWTLRRGVEPALAAQAFGQGVESLAASAARGQPSPLAAAIRDGLEIKPLDKAGGTGGRIDLPVVLANAARPAWFFPVAGVPATGWLATDPAGLDGVGDMAKLFSGPTAGARAADCLLAAEWDLSEAFRLALLDVVRDRLEMLPDDLLPNREAAIRLGAGLNTLLTAYPKGSAEAAGDAKLEQIRIKLRIPYGIQINIQ